MKNRAAYVFSVVVLSLLTLRHVSAQAGVTDGKSVPKVLGSFHVVSPNFLGINIENVYLNPYLSWTDPALSRAMEKVGVRTVRFPGGDAGNYWDWQNGTIYPIGGSSDTTDVLNDLYKLTSRTQTSATYNLNVMTYQNALLDQASLSVAMSNQIQMLEAAKAMGIAVKNLELGNEFFWTTSNHDHEFPTAKDYATAMNLWIPALKARFPGAKLAAVASIPYSYDSRTRDWNAPVLSNL